MRSYERLSTPSRPFSCLGGSIIINSNVRLDHVTLNEVVCSSLPVKLVCLYQHYRMKSFLSMSSYLSLISGYLCRPSLGFEISIFEQKITNLIFADDQPCSSWTPVPQSKVRNYGPATLCIPRRLSLQRDLTPLNLFNRILLL
jgi:hypothetical protein